MHPNARQRSQIPRKVLKMKHCSFSLSFKSFPQQLHHQSHEPNWNHFLCEICKIFIESTFPYSQSSSRAMRRNNPGSNSAVYKFFVIFQIVPARSSFLSTEFLHFSLTRNIRTWKLRQPTNAAGVMKIKLKNLRSHNEFMNTEQAAYRNRPTSWQTGPGRRNRPNRNCWASCCGRNTCAKLRLEYNDKKRNSNCMIFASNRSINFKAFPSKVGQERENARNLLP